MKKILSLIVTLLMFGATAQALPFETTTEPTTYPIQWYFLKMGGMYLCCYGDEIGYDSSASASNDEFLWCFVTTSQGKTVLYNKSCKKYMEGGFYFSSSGYVSTVNYVEYTSGNSFYICFTEGNQKYYIDCDADNGITYSSSKYHSATAVAALYEGLIDATGYIEFSELEVNDEECSFYFDFRPGEGDSGSELFLYVNDQRVAMPYTIQRTNQEQTVEAKARVEFVNPRIRPLEASHTYTIPALSNASPIVTTPSPTTLPIHWYQLKVNDKYVYYDPAGGISEQIKLTPTASSQNNFLWCFVQASPDKIVIFNRAAQKYIRMAQYFTPDINNSYISYVEEKDGLGFYIKYYYTGDNRTYYFYEYIDNEYDCLASTGKMYADVFNAIEVLVEEDLLPVTETTLTPYDVHTPNNVQTDTNEDYHKLFDKDRSTKWCVDNSTGSWETIWVDFKSDVAFIPTKYVMTTGNDTYSWSGRNPKKWKIFAKAKESDSWTTIVDVSDGAAAGLGTLSTTDYNFDISGVSKKYQYFRFEVSEVCGRGGWQNNHYVFQLAELALSGYTSNAVAGDIDGNGHVDGSDLNILINIVLGKDNADNYGGRANVDGQDGVNGSDINTIINILLGK